jgi:hypothetical protein
LAAREPTSSPEDEDLKQLKARLSKAALEHQTLDGWAYNLGTLAIVTLTAAATLASGDTFGGDTAWLGAIFAAVAGVLVALDRTLAFGARWRYHHDMRNSYLYVLDAIEFRALISPETRQQNIDKAWAALQTLRRREASIPGSGVIGEVSPLRNGETEKPANE